MGMTGRLGVTIVAVASAAGMSLQGASAFAATTMTKYTTTTTNVRSGTSTATTIVGKIAAGTAVTGVLQSNGWITIATPTTYAGRYVSGAVLSATAPNRGVESGTVTATVRGDYLVVVNVRSAPSLDAPVVAQIAKGTVLKGAVASGWMHVAQGYISTAVLEVGSTNMSVANGKMPGAALCAIPAVYNSPEQFSVTSPVSGRKYAYTRATTRFIQCAVLPSLIALENAYTAQNGHPATIDLAYRSADEQAAWLNNPDVQASPVGRSMHGWGLAVDFRDNGLPDDGRNEFTSKGAGFAWLTKNASRFAFAVDPIVPAKKFGWKTETFHWNFIG